MLTHVLLFLPSPLASASPSCLCCPPVLLLLQLLDELQVLNNRSEDLDVSLIDKKIDQVCMGTSSSSAGWVPCRQVAWPAGGGGGGGGGAARAVASEHWRRSCRDLPPFRLPCTLSHVRRPLPPTLPAWLAGCR